MPVQYEGVLAEHEATRKGAGLFDVSHMGQARLRGNWRALERVITADLGALAPGEQKYTLLLNDEGGIKDDLMVSRPDEDGLFLVVNAATKDSDFAYIAERLEGVAELEVLEERALLALQGPQAAEVMKPLAPDCNRLVFMQTASMSVHTIPCLVSRSGYTGEDGFEISIPRDRVQEIAEVLTDHKAVRPVGLAARDSLRLEAGLCLYGHDMDETRTPVEAALTWALAKTRRERADFPGAQKILSQIAEKPSVRRVGIRLEGRAPAREGAELVSETGEALGHITSGGFGPSLGQAIAMGYVQQTSVRPGTSVQAMVRGRALQGEIVKLPFVPHRFYRGG